MKAAAVVVALASTALLTEAFPSLVSRLPNGGNVAGVAALGHVATSGGGPRNAFGLAFKDAGLKWTVALCQADSDGDGQTNGQELGDPCCKWANGGALSYSSGVSHPGDASSKADPSLWAAVSCGTPTTAPSTQPPATPKPTTKPATTAPAATETPKPGSPTTAPKSKAPSTTTATPATDSSSGSTADATPSSSTTTEEPTEAPTDAPSSAGSASESSSGSTGGADVPSPSSPVPSPSGASTVVAATGACIVALAATLL